MKRASRAGAASRTHPAASGSGTGPHWPGAEWAPTVARILLGLVLGWFGYHELVYPALWTGYVPLVPATSTVAVVLVLAHGWLLLVLAVAMVAGIAPRLAAGISALLLLQIVISLTITGGFSDLTMRD